MPRGAGSFGNVLATVSNERADSISWFQNCAANKKRGGSIPLQGGTLQQGPRNRVWNASINDVLFLGSSCHFICTNLSLHEASSPQNWRLCRFFVRLLQT